MTAIRDPVGRLGMSLRLSVTLNPSGPVRLLSPRSTSPLAEMTTFWPLCTRISVLVQSAAAATLMVFSTLPPDAVDAVSGSAGGGSVETGEAAGSFLGFALGEEATGSSRDELSAPVEGSTVLRAVA